MYFIAYTLSSTCLNESQRKCSCHILRVASR